MTLGNSVRIALAVAATALALVGCDRKSPTEPWPAIVDPLVYSEGAGTDAEFHAFLGSKYDALAIDDTEAHSGTTSLRFTVPAAGDPTGSYAGGAFVTQQARDLASYDALSFWVKASRAATLNEAGFGIDITGPSRYRAARTAIPITTAWSQVIVPIPLPSKLTKEKGLFFLSEGAEGGAANTIWIDDVQFITLGAPPKRPVLATRTENKLVGATVDLAGATWTVFNLGGADTAVTVAHAPGYFSFQSSDPAVATVTDGALRILAAGTATLTAKLGDLDAAGRITANATASPVGTPAPTPSVPASNVFSLFSNSYANGVNVDTWSASWDQADVTDIAIAGNTTKVYQNLVFAGITMPPIDMTARTHFHMDVWVPTGTTFKVKLVDFGADGAFGGIDDNRDTEHEMTFNAASTPALTLGEWVGLELALADFTGLASRAHLAQIVLSGDTRTVYVDNVYFHK